MAAPNYVVISSEVVIDSSNNSLVVDVGGSNETVSVAVGEWYFTGAEANNIAYKLAAAVQTHSLITTCVVDDLRFDIGDGFSDPTVKLTLLADVAFKLEPEHASSTFDGGLVGFPDDTASLTSLPSEAEVKGVWVASQPAANEFKGPFSAEVNQQTALDGTVYTFTRGDIDEMHGFDFDFIIPWKVLVEEKNPALSEAQNATFQSIHGIASDGRGLKIHQAEIDTGGDAEQLKTSQIITDGTSWVGQTDWVFSDRDAALFAPGRLSAGLELYSFSVRLRKKV